MFFCASLCGTEASAQTFAPELQKVFDLCLQIRDFVRQGNQAALSATNAELKKCATSSYTNIHCIDSVRLSLDGHLVFDTRFIDSLMVNKKVYQFASRYKDPDASRQAFGTSSVMMRTFAVGKKSKSVFTLPVYKNQQLAVVTEPGGRIKLVIRDQNYNQYFNDTDDTRRGRPYRKVVFDLKHSDTSSVEMEVHNRSGRDISFVVMTL